MQLILGLALLLGGGESLLRGASALARQFGIPPLIVGLTIVAFGTSAPELAVNVSAALNGNGAVAFGNIVGSNLANIGLILAGAAVVRKLTIQSVIIWREIPMMLLASTAAMVMVLDSLRHEAPAQLDRAEGLLLLLLFTVFLYYTITETFRRRRKDPFLQQARQQQPSQRLKSITQSSALLVLGLVGLALGGEITVNGAVNIAEALGVSKGLIGLTIVAVGTSLPELSTTLLAARKGETDLAVGNVVGSNIFNLLFVLGVTSTIRPIPVPPGGEVDLLISMIFATALLLLSRRRGEVARVEGAALLMAYLAFIGWRTL